DGIRDRNVTGVQTCALPICEGAIGAVGEEDWVGAFFSAENDYARMTADALGAEYRCICQSGWGVLCGWDNDPRHALPGYYTRVRSEERRVGKTCTDRWPHWL